MKAILNTFTNIVGDPNAYYKLVPDDYDASKKYPTLLFLHGQGEKWWQAGKVFPGLLKTNLSAMLLNGTVQFPGVVFIPQCQTADWDNVYKYNADGSTGPTQCMPGAFAKDFFQRIIITDTNVDLSKVYLTGLSMGGGGAWSALYIMKDIFAGAIICAGWGPTANWAGLKAGVRVYHNVLDPTVNVSGDDKPVAAIKAQVPGCDIVYNRIEGVAAHDCWTKAYQDATLWVWLQSKSFSPAIVPDPVPMPGLNYAMFDGTFDKLPDFAALKPSSVGVVIVINPTPRPYALKLSGDIDIPTDGDYVFYLNSDDGSKMYIDELLVVDNDGLHGGIEKMGSVTLATGLHSIEIDYFQKSGNASLIAAWSGPGFSKKSLSGLSI